MYLNHVFALVTQSLSLSAVATLFQSLEIEPSPAYLPFYPFTSRRRSIGFPISGLELQARLKEEQSSIPVIFIASNGGARMRIQAMREGAVEFLAKPLDYQLLLKTVGAALDL